jgi:hypothetical protein
MLRLKLKPIEAIPTMRGSSSLEFPGPIYTSCESYGLFRVLGKGFESMDPRKINYV